MLADAQGHPSLETARAIVDVNAAGIHVVPVSGRNRLQMGEITRLLGWNHGFIAEIGCVVVPSRGAAPLYFTGLWPDDALRPGETPYDAIARVGAYDVLTRAFPGRIEQHVPHHLNREATFVLRGSIDVARVRDELASLELPVELVDNGIIHPPRTTLRGVDEVHAYHLAPAGISKAAAVAHDITRRDLDRASTISVGDSPTDAEMAYSVELAVVVANALADDRVASTVDEIAAAAALTGRPLNIAATRNAGGAGWAELADAWLAAREG